MSTIKYEAPEVKLAPLNAPRSRLMDIWSLGCVYLELLVWTLYGYAELQRLRDDLPRSTSFYQEVATDGARVSAQLHPAVQHWIHHMKETLLSNEKGAFRRLLDLIGMRLLVVPVKRSREATQPRTGTSNTEEEWSGGSKTLDVPKISLQRSATGNFELDSSSGYRADAEEMASELRTLLEGLKQGRIQPVETVAVDTATPYAAPPNYGGSLHPNDWTGYQVGNMP